MAPEDQRETSQQTSASDEEEQVREDQTSPSVTEIHNSTTECEEEVRPSLVQMDEKTFVFRLHSFMKEKGTPIERIPHLGFKQIDLWMIYKAVDKHGGYESVTTHRLWKKVYDELGGSPGSTSAATCTRRHYERLVLPFERHLKGEDDKPLPQSKPRKPYKRNLEGKVNKADGKRKKTYSEREMETELLTQRSADMACQSEAMMHPRFALWAANPDPRHSDHSPQNRTNSDFCSPVNGHVLQVPAPSSWVAHIPSSTAEVISPLEKKKRMAQASLNVPPASQREDKERPSVIQCSQSPAQVSPSRNGNSSDGSPLPSSSSSSRCSSPVSVSSEDSSVVNVDKSTTSTGSTENSSSTTKANKDKKSASCSQTPPRPKEPKRDVSQVSSQSLITGPVKSQTKDSAWRPYHNMTGKHFTHPFHPSSSFSTSTSSFSKVIPKSVQLLRPAPIRPSSKTPHSRLLQQDGTLTGVKKLGSMAPWLYHAEKRERSRTIPQKLPPTQQSLSQSATAASTLPASCVLSGYNKSGRDFRHQHPGNQAFLHHRMRLPPSQLMYQHVPVSPGLIGPAVYPYPYPIPFLNSQYGYTLPATNPIYPHKL
ncbi:AT-rich interactive domain-containing protein 5A [Nothobranchius furzeri]|uniref:AT rich interactive domain 5A (MRF1-like) n=4 Tax=Nothobranchius TaxID=28779 RepID=A0A1A8B2P9_NOTFU|nr:AT-rich interactive domain-containing protein 5A-like [Nothobranchius furzeri]